MQNSESSVFLLLSLAVLSGCASALDRPIRLEPEAPHALAADRAACRDYAERNGVINLGPMMGDSAQNQPDRERRDWLFLGCMKEKGYGF